MSIALNAKNLGLLPQEVRTPAYERSRLSPGIVHVGVGNFHRAHMAHYLDRLFSAGRSEDWAIVGAGVQPTNAAMRERLAAQDWLTTVVELDPKQLSARVVGSMINFLPVEPNAIVEALTDPSIRIVSLTVTEGGYFIDSARGGLDVAHPSIAADAANPDAPITIFGVMAKALARRRSKGDSPFTVLSCDNLPGNGNLTRQTLVGLAGMSDLGLANWIDANVAFPNSMVDCITPMTSDRERTMVRERFGVIDQVPVVCEPFRQWVIEDHFSAGRPALESVGVEFVTDVSQHELMKLRILNASHASIAYAAALLGYHFVHEAMADPDLVNWVRALQSRESIPTLKPLRGVDYPAYLETVIGRFANPEIGDTIPRLAEDGSDRQPKFILPTIRDALAQGGSVDGLALEVALWCRYNLGATETGQPISVLDRQRDELHQRALASTGKPRAFLENTSVFGGLAQDSRFSGSFEHWLHRLSEKGARTTIREYVSKV